MSSEASAEILKALHNIIVPLIHGAARDDKVLPEYEGGEFLNALQKFVISIIKSQTPNHQEGIAINLNDLSSNKITAAPEQRNIAIEDDDKLLDATTEEHMVESANKNEVNNPPQPLPLTPLERVREGLRKHVFNAMPIRMLRFQTQCSQFTITLVDRSTVFGYLLPMLEAEFDERQFFFGLSAVDKASHSYAQLEEIAIEKWVSKVVRYAILSHKWLSGEYGEITYENWPKGSELDTSGPGYQKLVNFCRVAFENHGITLGWMDTVCINKSSSSELDESIRSMFKWYRNAEICITHLSESITLSDIQSDAWFTRGWTLQELLAPKQIKFYSNTWRKLSEVSPNDKDDPQIRHQIELATTITEDELKSPLRVPIWRKMQWAAKRQVTRGEDSAYSLMGIFSVNMSIAYGEGSKHAFVRLLKKIIGTTKFQVDEVFNWAGPYSTTTSSLLPSSPLAYLQRSKTDTLRQISTSEPLLLTHLGLRIPALLLPAMVATALPYDHIGDFYATITIQPTAQIPRSYNILDARNRDKSSSWVFAILNCVAADDSDIIIERKCFAVLFRDPRYSHLTHEITPTGLQEKVSTNAPIVFELNRKTAPISQKYYIIRRQELERHGMQFEVMHL